VVFKVVWELFRDTAAAWWKHSAQRLGASLAFYTMLSAAPLLVIATAIAGFAYGKEAAEGKLVGDIRAMVGRDGAEVVQTMLAHAGEPTRGILATIVSLVVLLVGATGVFLELQAALNTIWEVKPKPSAGFLAGLRGHFAAFAMVLVIGFLLLVLVIASATLNALDNLLGPAAPERLWHNLDLLVSLAVITLLFALIFKVLPEARLRWRDVWVGAALTAGLFTLGKYLIGLYLGSSGMGTAYGAAGSLAVFLIWIYYSAQIFFFGAEFTHVYAQRFHRPPARLPETATVS
jgi:membrane protein